MTREIRPRNRAQVKLRLLEVAAYALTDLELYEGRTESVPALGTWDGTTPTNGTALYVGLSNGRSDPDGIASGLPMEDVFDVQCQVYVAGCPDWQRAELAAEAVLNAFDAVLRSLAGLKEQGGASEIPTADPPADAAHLAPWDVEKAYITESTGPYHPIPTPQVPTTIRPGVYDFTVTCVRAF